MKFLFIILTLFVALDVNAQCSEFDNLIKEGDRYLGSSNPNYQEAINAYTAAILACSDRAGEARQRVAKMVNDINALKDQAVKAERRAEVVKKQAEAAIAEVRLKNVSIFKTFTKLASELIYQLNYEEALDKLKMAIEIDLDNSIKKEVLTTQIEELLFFFAEGGRRLELAQTAVALLLRLEPSDTLMMYLERSVQENWESRDQFIPLLEALPSYEVLQERYYPRMISIPLGKDGVFQMGSDTSELGHKPDELLHRVRLSAYQMAETPVTFYQFAIFIEATERGVSSRAPYWGIRGDHPAVNVSWYESVEYANWLNEQNGYPPSYTITKITNSDTSNLVQVDYIKWQVNWNEDSKGFRLATESEWELAARGGVGAPRTVFSGSDDLEEVGWYWQNSGDKPLDGDWDLNRIFDNNDRTHAVKGKKHNGLGIYDLSGNVFEWCWDWYDSDYYDECNQAGVVENPTGPESSTEGRVIRGGSWFYDAAFSRTANRFRYNPANRNRNIGFRLVFVP